MINWFNNEIQRIGQIRKKELSPYDIIKHKGVKYCINAYEVENIGTYSTLEFKAMFGLFKVVSIIFTPLNKDMPILSYDLIKVMNKRTLLIETYNTNIINAKYDSLIKIKNECSFPKNELQPRWYDSYKGEESISVKVKGHNKEVIELSKSYIEEFFRLMNASNDVSPEEKRIKVKSYVDQLFEKGGPSVDHFKKMIGNRAAYDLFTHYIFGAIK